MFLKPNADIVVVYNMLCKLTFPLGNWSIHFELRNKCDLLREKGPNAVKRRFKTQLTAFSLKMLRNIFTCNNCLCYWMHTDDSNKNRKFVDICIYILFIISYISHILLDIL